jgi:hypothetical protein
MKRSPQVDVATKNTKTREKQDLGANLGVRWIVSAPCALPEEFQNYLARLPSFERTTG